ncbi:MAG TPA: hypothetical protein VGI33_10280 [Paenibacillus sp.]
MNRKLKVGIHILILTMVFLLMACSTNDKGGEKAPSTKENTIISDIDEQTELIENDLDEQQANREKGIEREKKIHSEKETKKEEVVESIPDTGG